jgi:hypothetical protein
MNPESFCGMEATKTVQHSLEAKTVQRELCQFGYMIYATCNETSSDQYLQSDISKRTFGFMLYYQIDNIANMIQFFKTSAFR